MSVAFRGDGDDEHLDPNSSCRSRRASISSPPRELAQIHAKVIALETLLPALSDEAAITAARRELRYWRTRQATVQRVAPPNGASGAFGCTVAFRLNGQQRSITIVSDDEAHPASGPLSFSAPLCREMMDTEADDRADFAGKLEAIEILAIDVTSD
jgi:transcription elongation GreA/GreB family factor